MSLAQLLHSLNPDAVFDGLQEGVIIADCNGYLRYCNHAARTLLAHSACADAVTTPNAPVSALALALTPDSLPLIAADLPLARALRGEIITAMQLYPHGGSAPPQPLHVSARPLYDAAGHCSAAMMTLIPAPPPPIEVCNTPQVFDQVLMRALDQLEYGITIADARAVDMPIIYVNNGFIQLTGYSREEIIGRNGRFLHHSDGDQLGLGQLRTALRDGRSAEVMLRNYRKNGTLFWNCLLVMPLTNVNGDITHFIGCQRDMTPLMTTQERLRHERDFLRMVLDAMPTLFIIIDEQAHFITVNQQVCELSGYDRQDLHHMTLMDFFTGENREQAQVAIAHSIATGDPIALELPLITRAGARVPLYYRAVRHLQDGRPVLIGTGHDVSEYRALLTALQMREERLSRSHAFANLGLWDWDIALNEVYWSDRVPELLGSPESYRGFSFEDFLQAVHPLDRMHVRQCLERCVEGQDVLDEEFRVQWPDGSLRWMLVRGNVIHNYDGQPLRMFGVVQDITALKHAEFVEKHARQQIQSIIDSLRTLICVVDEHGNILSLNRAWQQYAYSFGAGAPRLTIGSNYLQLCDDIGQQGRTDMLKLAQGVRAVLRGQLYDFETEISIVRLESEEIHLMRVTPLHGASEDHPRVVINHHNITASRQIEADLRRAKEEAERASHAKSEFLSSMSHELRTPMNAVLGFSQLLEQDDTLNADQLENVTEILRAGKHLLELINEVLDLARIEAGKIELALEPVVLAEVVNESVVLLTPLARQRQVRIDIAPLSDVVLLADRMRLKQVMINLLTNAIKYNRPHGHVQVGAQLFTETPPVVRVHITDTGFGIPAAQIDDLFQPFARLRRDEYQEGTGIGLAVCRRLIEAMGGCIGATSELDAGSQFWLELTPVEMSANLLNMPVIQQLVALPIVNRQYTVLQIEDNPSNLKLLERLLARYPNIRALSATCAAAGIELARRQQPNLILMDINMPGMDGYAALAILRGDIATQHIPVVAVTANATASDIERGLTAGFSAYLTKPLNLVQLNETLVQILQMMPITSASADDAP